MPCARRGLLATAALTSGGGGFIFVSRKDASPELTLSTESLSKGLEVIGETLPGPGKQVHSSLLSHRLSRGVKPTPARPGQMAGWRPQLCSAERGPPGEAGMTLALRVWGPGGHRPQAWEADSL